MASAAKKRRSYTPAYRQEAAHLVIDTGRPIAVVAREIGMGEQLLGRWVAQERARMQEPPDENKELRMDREFLKKAAAFFVTENQNR